MEFSFSLDLEEGKRQAFRARVPGLLCIVQGRDVEFPVKDISATGMALVDEGNNLSDDEVVYLDLLINHRAYMQEVKAKVIRVIGNGIVGVNFIELDRRQEAKLDKLVLEVQKRLINMRKLKTADDGNT
jgi:c-di-GMP-binding flagellar brake protein YcgR